MLPHCCPKSLPWNGLNLKPCKSSRRKWPHVLTYTHIPLIGRWRLTICHFPYLRTVWTRTLTIHDNSIAGKDALNLGDNNHSSNPAPPEYVATWTCDMLQSSQRQVHETTPHIGCWLGTSLTRSPTGILKHPCEYVILLIPLQDVEPSPFHTFILALGFIPFHTQSVGETKISESERLMARHLC